MLTNDGGIRSICVRIARLESERKALAADITEIKTEARGQGFDTALIGRTVRIMLLAGAKRQAALDQHELFDTYLGAAGLLPDTPEAP